MEQAQAHDDDKCGNERRVEEELDRVKNLLAKTIVCTARNERVDDHLRADIIAAAFALLAQHISCNTILRLAESLGGNGKPDTVDDVMAGLIVVALELSDRTDKGRQRLNNMLTLANEQCQRVEA
jgi:hypothetical protein